MTALRAFVLLTALLGVRALAFGESAPGRTVEVALALGALLVAAHAAAAFLGARGLPRITGAIAAGALLGPGALGFVREEMLSELAVAGAAAGFFVGLRAAAALRADGIRAHARAATWIAAAATAASTLAVAAAVYAVRARIPLLSSMPPAHAFAGSLVAGAALSLASPAAVLALRGEARARGPVAGLSLAAATIAVLLALAAFLALSLASKRLVASRADVLLGGRAAITALAGTAAVALAAAALMALAARSSDRVVVAALAVAAGAAALAGDRGLAEPFLAGLAAGLVIARASAVRERVGRALEPRGAIAELVFFSVAGASLRFDLVPIVGWIPLMIALVRGVAIVGGARIGARIAGAPRGAGRWIALALVPQDGAGLALAAIASRSHSPIGDRAAAVLLVAVALNVVLGPPLFRLALARSGEGAARGAGAGDEASDARATTARL